LGRTTKFFNDGSPSGSYGLEYWLSITLGGFYEREYSEERRKGIGFGGMGTCGDRHLELRSTCACGPVVRALDQRARGLEFDSPTGHE
jgi:hypothetical protein